MPTFRSLVVSEEQAAPEEQILWDLQDLAEFTERPTLLYVSNARSTAPDATPFPCPEDLFLFSDALRQVEGDRLDLILNSQGGTPEVAEQLVVFLRGNISYIRCFVPHLVTGAAALLALACNEICLDDRAALGPIEPYVPVTRHLPNGTTSTEYVSASAILQGFDHARETLREEGEAGLTAYAPLLERYDLHTFELCRNAVELARELVRQWLKDYMFHDLSARESSVIIRRVLEKFSKPSEFLSPQRPIGLEAARNCGLRITDLRANSELRERIWRLYWLTSLLFEQQRGVYKVCATSQGLLYLRGEKSVRATLSEGELRVL